MATVAPEKVQGRDFLVGDFFFADIMMYPNYVLRRALIERLADLPNLRAWAVRMALRPAVRMQLLDEF